MHITQTEVTESSAKACDNAPTSQREDHVAAKKSSSAGAKKAAPKQAASRADYGGPIGPYFERLPPEKRAPLEKLRRLVEETVPNAVSGLKWGAPFWTLDGKMLCAMGPLKHTVALSIYAPPEAFDDPKGQLEGKSAEYRVLKVKDEREIDAASVKRWLEAAVAAAM
jgi:hypothetical protein